MIARRFNYGVEFGPGGAVEEEDLASCGHCQVQLRVEPSKHGHIIARVLPPCSFCRKYVCDACAQKATMEGCSPWEKKMEADERRFRFLKSVGI